MKTRRISAAAEKKAAADLPAGYRLERVAQWSKETKRIERGFVYVARDGKRSPIFEGPGSAVFFAWIDAGFRAPEAKK